MDTITKPEIPAAERVGRLGRLRSRMAHRIFAVAAVVGGLVAGGASSAYALGSSTDLTGGNGDTFITSILNYFKDHVIVSVLLLAASVIGVRMLLRWGKRAASS